MSYLFSPRAPLASLFVILWPGTLWACAELSLNEPPAGARVSEPVLNLRWQPLSGISEYRLQAEGRQPEGGIEWTVDVVVNGHTYRLDVPEKANLMAVKLRVSADCDEGDSRIRSRSAHVLIDRR